MTFTDPCLADPTADQQLVLDLIGRVFLEHGRWPAWAWLEEEVENQGLNAQAVVVSMPREARHNYSYLTPMRPRTSVPHDEMRLTIAGLRHVALADATVQSFCSFVAALGAIRKTTRLDPFANERPRVRLSEIAAMKAQQRNMPVIPIDKSMLEFMQKEPVVWMCQVVDTSTDDPVIELAPEVRRVAEVNDIGDYMARLSEFLAVAPIDTEIATVMSPFSLPAALDYLDTVWRLKFGAGLVVPSGVERSARLALAVASPEEAESALSALAEMIKGLQVPGVPGVGGHALQRLGPFLQQSLSDESVPAVGAAIAVLDAARVVRHGVQHAGAGGPAITACQTLGVPYPIHDWPSAWAHIQNAVAVACDTIRQEIHASL